MHTQLETISPLERRLTVTFAMDTLQAQMQARLKKLAKTVRIQGFRPGKAPLRIVEQNYGVQVHEEVVGAEVQQRFAQAVQQEGLRVAGYPRFESPSTQAESGQFSFSAVFEIYPEIELQSMADCEIEKPLLTVTDDEVEKTLDVLRRQRTRFDHVERAAASGDRVIIDFKGVIDGETFAGGSADNFPFVLGQGQMLPEFEAGVEGLKEGESREVEVTFPEDYHGKEVAGKKAVFTITVKNVAAATIPELDEAFAKALGIADGTVEALRAEVRKNVEREVKRRLQARVKENVMQALLNKHKFDLPKALVSMEIGRLADQARQELAQRGLDVKSMPPVPPDLFAEQAERRVALGLLLNAMIEKHEIKADDAKVRELVQEYADSYENPSEVVDWYYASPERLDGPTAMVIEDSLVEFVLSQAKVTEKTVSFDELMGTR